MARPKMSDVFKRTKYYNIRLNDIEKEMIHDLAVLNGKEPTTFIRDTLLKMVDEHELLGDEYKKKLEEARKEVARRMKNK